MPSEVAHVALANRLQGSLDSLLLDVKTHVEIIAVTAFYKSVHVVEAVFARDPAIRHTREHKARLRMIASTRRYSQLYKPFNALWSASLVARYLEDQGSGRGFTQFSEFLPPDAIRRELLDRYLLTFENLAVQLLSDRDALHRYRASEEPSRTGQVSIAKRPISPADPS
jgi:hypothetical protein